MSKEQLILMLFLTSTRLMLGNSLVQIQFKIRLFVNLIRPKTMMNLPVAYIFRIHFHFLNPLWLFMLRNKKSTMRRSRLSHTFQMNLSIRFTMCRYNSCMIILIRKTLLLHFNLMLVYLLIFSFFAQRLWIFNLIFHYWLHTFILNAIWNFTIIYIFWSIVTR